MMKISVTRVTTVRRAEWPHEHHFGRGETAWALLLPPVLTALLALGAGLLASAPFSPLEWARLIARREFYGP